MGTPKEITGIWQFQTPKFTTLHNYAFPLNLIPCWVLNMDWHYAWQSPVCWLLMVCFLISLSFSSSLTYYKRLIIYTLFCWIHWYYYWDYSWNMNNWYYYWDYSRDMKNLYCFFIMFSIIVSKKETNKGRRNKMREETTSLYYFIKLKIIIILQIISLNQSPKYNKGR